MTCFTSFGKLMVLVLAASFVMACQKSPAAPTPEPGGNIVAPPPGSPPLTKVPSGPVQFEYVGTGEPFPAMAEVLYLSPQPGSRVQGGIFGQCSQFPNTCFQRKIKVCVDPSLRFPGNQGPGNIYFSNQRGVMGRVSYGLVGLTGPDANGCYVSDMTLKGGEGAYNPFPSSSDSTELQWMNIFIHQRVYRAGENPPGLEDEGTLAFASFFVYYRNN